MSQKQSFSVADVAQFMFEESQKFDFLDQDAASFQIQKKYGPEFVSRTNAGGLSIRPDVIDEFKALVRATGRKAEWSSGKKKYWEILPKKKLKGESLSDDGVEV